MGRTTSPLAAALLMLFCAAGCDAADEADTFDDEDQAEELGEAESAFTGIAWLSATSTTGSPVYASGGVSNGTQAFLSGVYGNLAQIGGVGGSIASLGAFVSLPLFYVRAVPGTPSSDLRADGTAVYPGNSSATTVTCNHSGPGSSSTPIPAPPGASQWRCFLMEVRNTTGNSFDSFDDRAIITYSGANATLTCENDAQASAECVEITTYLGSAATSGVSTVNLGADTTGKVCLLRSVSGRFRTNTTTSGVRTYRSGANWYLTTTTNQGGYADCVI